MTKANARRGPGEPHSLSPEARRISPGHLARLRAILVRAGSVTAARALLGTSAELVETALTRGMFHAKTIDRLEAAIDDLAREPGAA